MTNAELETIVDTTDEWIASRTGIRERRICAPNEATSDLGIHAARAALADAGLQPNDLDLIICCTMTTDHGSPSTACIIQHGLGITRPIPAFDLAAACSGFVYGCSVGASFIQTGTYRHVLVVGAEAMSRLLDWTDRNTCVLFGDGAGAVVLGPVEPGRGLISSALGADGSQGEALIVPAGGSREPLTHEGLEARRQYMRMAGKEVYRFATNICGQAIEEALAQPPAQAPAGTPNPHTLADLDLIIPHQANVRIIDAAARKLGIPLERFVVNLEKFGNTSAATIPLAMHDARADGRLKPGTLFAIVAFGGGLTYGASIWRW